MKAVATRPRTLTWRAPSLPSRVNRAFVSRKVRASLIAARWAFSIFAAVAGSARAHSTETLLTGEKVRSYPATALVWGRECLAMVAANSRASAGSRPCSAVKNSRATSVRIPARSAAGTGQSPGRPADSLKAAIRLATSTRNALTSFL